MIRDVNRQVTIAKRIHLRDGNDDNQMALEPHSRAHNVWSSLIIRMFSIFGQF